MYEPGVTKFNGRPTGITKGHQEQYRPKNSTTLSHKFWPCRDGLDCTLHDSSVHCAKYSHPCRFADRCNKKVMEPNLTHEPNRVPQCEYDANCLKMDDPRHRASFWHSNKPDFLRACRNHPRCSNSSYEHRSKYSHGEYKSIFNRTSSISHSQDHRDHRHAQRKGSDEHSTKRRPTNSTIGKSLERIGRHRSLSAKYSPHRREKSHSHDSQRSTDSKTNSSISPHVSRRKSYRPPSRREIGSNAKTVKFSDGNRHRSPVTPSRTQFSPHRHQRSKSSDSRSSSSTGRSERSSSVSSRSPISILRHARRSRSRESDSRNKTSRDRRSISRSQSK